MGFEPTTSGLDLPVLYRLSYEASTGAGRGNFQQAHRYLGWYLIPLQIKMRGTSVSYMYFLWVLIGFPDYRPLVSWIVLSAKQTVFVKSHPFNTFHISLQKKMVKNEAQNMLKLIWKLSFNSKKVCTICPVIWHYQFYGCERWASWSGIVFKFAIHRNCHCKFVMPINISVL